jgi:Rod binding domain-containing protein
MAKQTAEEIQHEQLTETARKWVSQTFFGTLLKQMRESPFKSDLFGGGRGEEAFGPLYDAQLADRMARGAGRSLVDSIVRKIEGRTARRASAPKVSGVSSEGGSDAATR